MAPPPIRHRDGRREGGFGDERVGVAQSGLGPRPCFARPGAAQEEWGLAYQAASTRVRGLGPHQLDGSQGRVSDGANVFGAKGRSFVKESERSLSRARPRGPGDSRPEAEERATSRVVARVVLGPSTVTPPTQAKLSPAKVGTLEETQGKSGEVQRIRVAGKPRRLASPKATIEPLPVAIQ